MPSRKPACTVVPTDPGKRSAVMALCADARKLLLEDRFYEARKVVQQALRLKPTHAAAVYVLGAIEMASGSLEEAAKLMKRTTELSRFRRALNPSPEQKHRKVNEVAIKWRSAN